MVPGPAAGAARAAGAHLGAGPAAVAARRACASMVSPPRGAGRARTLSAPRPAGSTRRTSAGRSTCCAATAAGACWTARTGSRRQCDVRTPRSRRGWSPRPTWPPSSAEPGGWTSVWCAHAAFRGRMRARHPLGRNAAPGESCHVRAPVPAAGLRTAASRTGRCAQPPVVRLPGGSTSCWCSPSSPPAARRTTARTSSGHQPGRRRGRPAAAGRRHHGRPVARSRPGRTSGSCARCSPGWLAKQGVDAAAVVRTEAPSACRDGVAEVAP